MGRGWLARCLMAALGMVVIAAATAASIVAASATPSALEPSISPVPFPSPTAVATDLQSPSATQTPSVGPSASNSDAEIVQLTKDTLTLADRTLIVGAFSAAVGAVALLLVAYTIVRDHHRRVDLKLEIKAPGDSIVITVTNVGGSSTEIDGVVLIWGQDAEDEGAQHRVRVNRHLSGSPLWARHRGAAVPERHRVTWFADDVRRHIAEAKRDRPPDFIRALGAEGRNPTVKVPQPVHDAIARMLA
jgi:hypothetical protein